MATNGIITSTTWTDSVITANVTEIRAIHFTEIRTAIGKIQSLAPGVTNCGYNPCQSCQSHACQSCQSYPCQTCQSYPCQSCQSYPCQSCQSAGAVTCQSQCYTPNCNCDCNCCSSGDG